MANTRKFRIIYHLTAGASVDTGNPSALATVETENNYADPGAAAAAAKLNLDGGFFTLKDRNNHFYVMNPRQVKVVQVIDEETAKLEDLKQGAAGRTR